MSTDINDTQQITEQPLVSEPKKGTDIVQVELQNLTQLMNDSEPQFRNILSQIYKVMTLLHRLGSKENKNYALNKELTMQVEIKKIKNTYNAWGMLAITVLSAGVTIAGGVVGIFSALPGTAAGEDLAKLGSVFASFKNKDFAKNISSISQAISGIGQGTGVFGKIFENKNEAERAVLQFHQSQLQRKHEDSNRAYSEENQLAREALRKSSEAESAANNIITSIISRDR